jgi:hypothetical protein
MSKIIFSIDPGNIDTAFCVWDGSTILEFGKIENEEFLEKIHKFISATITPSTIHFVIEKIASYGLAVGATVFDTAEMTGRIEQKVKDHYLIFISYPPNFKKVFRRDVKLHICGSVRAKDGNIRQALIDRFEPELQAKQRPKGLLKGLTADCWQAFALAVTYFDQNS